MSKNLAVRKNTFAEESAIEGGIALDSDAYVPTDAEWEAVYGPQASPAPSPKRGRGSTGYFESASGHLSSKVASTQKRRAAATAGQKPKRK